MPEFAWVELERDIWRQLWEEFKEDFGFRGGWRPEDWPAIQEPVPSVAWDLGPFSAAKPVAQLVCDVLRECTEYWDSVFNHDGVHPSVQYRPHRIVDIDDIDGWQYCLYPNGDYMIFVARDHSFGILGDHYENSLCFFGQRAVDAMAKLHTGQLSRILRRDGRPVTTP